MARPTPQQIARNDAKDRVAVARERFDTAQANVARLNTEIKKTMELHAKLRAELREAYLECGAACAAYEEALIDYSKCIDDVADSDRQRAAAANVDGAPERPRRYLMTWHHIASCNYLNTASVRLLLALHEVALAAEALHRD